MTRSKKFKRFLFVKAAAIIRKMRLYSLFNFSNDTRPDAPFKLVFFCGQYGIEYLNASLFSVYRTWKFLPEVLIVTDGTPTDVIKNKLIKWPKEISVISWEECANYYKIKGDHHIYSYASQELWGKKFVACLYCAEHFATLYSDSDVLWFTSPTIEDISYTPSIKMSLDVDFYYNKKIIESLDEQKCFNSVPLNCGVMYLHGNFSNYPKWENLCSILPECRGKTSFSEQTAFAILNNHFNKEDYWRKNEVLTKVDDTYKFNYTKAQHPDVVARHYVSEKGITFWRDFVYMCFKN
jgi:hypothetical protein